MSRYINVGIAFFFTISYAAHKALNAQEAEENKSETTQK